MCNLETTTTTAIEGQAFNPTAISALPDRQHCLYEVVYVGGSNDYDPGATMTPISLKAVRAQNRENPTNYTPFAFAPAEASMALGDYQPRYASVAAQPSFQQATPLIEGYGSHAHESKEAHAQHAH